MILIHIAAEMYSRQHGKPPDHLQELLEGNPRMAPEVLLDPFGGEPLRINRDGGRWQLYSVGENLEDHGGSEIPGQRKQNDFFLYLQEGKYP